jgi:hypothetical protein
MTKRAKKTAVRELSAIVNDLKTELRAESESILNAGRLHIEAKEQIKHGEWLRWLEREFDLSDRTAQNYMRAARFWLKYATVSDLVVLWGAAENLSPSALYAISEEMPLYTPEAIAAILKEAEGKRIDEDGAWEIADSLRPEEELLPDAELEPELLIDEEAEAEAEAEYEAEAEAMAILDGPPPELPPTEPAQPAGPSEPEAWPAFEMAIGELLGLHTKPLAWFAGTKYDSEAIETVACFLHELAAKLQAKAAA